jgi:uncharacterized protein DUF3558
MRTLRIALASLLLVAGCSSIETGDPTAVDEPTTTTGGAPTTEPGDPTTTTTPSKGPKRPKDIDVGKVDACQIMNKLPVRKYGLDGHKPLGGTSSVFPGAKDCFSSGIANNLALDLTVVTDQGASDYLQTANAKITPFQAQGYPLYVLENEQATFSCFGVLDVHDGQFVWITYSMASPTDTPKTPKAKLCKTVPMIAASTVKALN